jgi:hypothetical protein
MPNRIFFPGAFMAKWIKYHKRKARTSNALTNEPQQRCWYVATIGSRVDVTTYAKSKNAAVPSSQL